MPCALCGTVHGRHHHAATARFLLFASPGVRLRGSICCRLRAPRHSDAARSRSGPVRGGCVHACHQRIAPPVVRRRQFGTARQPSFKHHVRSSPHVPTLIFTCKRPPSGSADESPTHVPAGGGPESPPSDVDAPSPCLSPFPNMCLRKFIAVTGGYKAAPKVTPRSKVALHYQREGSRWPGLLTALWGGAHQVNCYHILLWRSL